jgi:hypothetical protein
MPADSSQILARMRRAEAKRLTTDSVCQEIADYMLPRKAFITRYNSGGERNTIFQFDSTAEDAGQMLVSLIVSTAISPDSKWYGLKTREDDLNEDQEVMEWCEEVADRQYLALNQSNFVQEAAEALLDAVFFGTGCLFQDELKGEPGRFGGYNFKAIAMGRYAIEEDQTGQVDTLYRRFQVTARIARTIWGDAIGEEAARLAEDRPDEMLSVVHGVYPREKDGGKGYTGQDRKRMPWASCYVLEKGQKLLAESGFREFPYAVLRWSKAPDEIYGRGLGHRAWADVRTLNRYVELDLRAGEKATDPPLEAQKDLIEGEISLRPADITWTLGPQAITPIESAARFEVTADRIEKLQSAVRRVFHTEIIQQFITRTSPEITATEAHMKWQLLLWLIGSTAFGRIQSEFLQPVVSRGVSQMMRAGALPPVPSILRERGADIDIKYESPLSRAQRREEGTAIQLWTADLGALAQAHPNVFDIQKPDDIGRHLAAVYGVPPDLIEDPRAVQQLRGQRQDAQQKQQALAAVAQGAETLGKAGPGIKALTEMAGQNGQGPPGAPPNA